MPRVSPPTAVIDGIDEESPSNDQNDTTSKSFSWTQAEGLLPTPIQIFLWRQTDPFIKKHFGPLTDASALNFSRILVQNIRHGLSPSLTDAIGSIPRWLFFQAALPHVIVACGLLIEHHSPKNALSPSSSSSISTPMNLSTSLHLPVPAHFLASTPLSSTLSLEQSLNQSRMFFRPSASCHQPLNPTEIRLFQTLHHLMFSHPDKEISMNRNRCFSLNVLELFIYLFMPYIQSYLHANEREFFSSADLMPGMQLIWQPLFEYRQPNIPMFNTFIKSGEKTSVSQQRTPPVGRSQEIQLVKPTTTECPSQTDSDSVFDLCHQTLSSQDSQLQAPLVHMNSICSVSDLNRSSVTTQSAVGDPPFLRPGLSPSTSVPSMPFTFASVPTVQSPISVVPKARSSSSPLLASHFDVGILRALFSPSWLTDGYLWCLEYLHQRLIDISDQILSTALIQGVFPTDLLRWRNLSLPDINTLDEHNYHYYVKSRIGNERRTTVIIERQHWAMEKEKGSRRTQPGQRFSSFYRKIRGIHYIDEDDIEHLDLAELAGRDHWDRLFSSSRNRFLLMNSRLFSLKIRKTSRRRNRPRPSENLSAMKSFSASDREINYKCLEDGEDTQGASEYVNRNGTMNFGVILAGLHAITCKEEHLKICELVMNILDVLFGLAVISSTDDDREKEKWFHPRDQHRRSEVMDEWHKQIDVKDNQKYQLAMDIVLRILKRLGCSHCHLSDRTFTADQLRGKVRLALNRLHQLNPHRFEKCFLEFVLRHDLSHVFRVFHALCGYCSISNVGLGHYAPYISSKSEVETRLSYLNNFGATQLSRGSAAIEGTIFQIVVKPLVTRLNTMEKSLLHVKNVALYGECRAFLLYLKETHGGIFRSLIFSALIDPQRKLQTQRCSAEKTVRIIDQEIKISSTADPSNDAETSADPVGPIDDSKEQRSVSDAEYQRLRSQTESLAHENHSSVSTQPDRHRYVDLDLIRTGLLRLHLLLQCCPPGSVPDPQFLSNLLFLDAPVLGKAAYLLECAHFVHRCSLGQWPEWMRTTYNTSRPLAALPGRVNPDHHFKLNRLYQAAAARMFYTWGEALSSQLELVLNTETDPNRQWNGDETYEDYYNEARVNHSGHDCPYSLQLVVCLLLYEITTFVRETYETLPKLPSASEANARHPRSVVSPSLVDSSSILIHRRSADRLRLDSVVSQVSQRSAVSVGGEPPILLPMKASSAMVINMNPLNNERHISFSIRKESDSNVSNHTTIPMNDDDEPSGNIDGKPSVSLSLNRTGNVTSSVAKSRFVRRGSAKLRKPSVRMKELGKNPSRLSIRSRRRSHVLNLSADNTGGSTLITHPMMETTNESSLTSEDLFDQENFNTMVNTRLFPWVKVAIRIFNRINLHCDHRTKCLENCYQKQRNSCAHLIQALMNMYQSPSSQCHTTAISDRLPSLFVDEGRAEQLEEDEIDAHFLTITSYLKKQVGPLIQVPLMILCKTSVLLEDEHYSQILRPSWELLLDPHEEIAACAATMLILTAARSGHLIDRIVQQDMQSPVALTRYRAILKFRNLWRFRSQFRMRLEDGAHAIIKILPPSMEFVLPSPLLGIANLQTVDPPWMSHAKTLVQQVTLNQEEMRAVMTASKSRQKHQQELIHSALMSEENSKRVARENFSLSTVSILQAASLEAISQKSKDDEDDVYLDDDRAVEASVQIRPVQGTLPSAFSVAIFHLVDMLEDNGMIDTGAAVSGAARKALWTCLLDEPTLLVRFFFEKLSHKERRVKALQRLRSLMTSQIDMPAQCAHAIFNSLLGLLISMIRSPLDGSQELILTGLTLLWQVIPYLHGLVLKDLKQILRTEQAEMMILITGNIPSAKRVIVHGPDASQIPTQSVVAEDTLFSSVLQESMEFFGIPDSRRDQYYLIDIKTRQIHIPETYVRDFYFFRRNIYPQLSLVSMESKQAQEQLEHMAMFLKTTELSKVLFARHLLENTSFNQIHSSMTFFHNELMKSPLFPRKPLESDFNLQTKLFDRELFNLDMLHKYNWIKLICCIFFNLDGKTSSTWDITLFLNVLNGSFTLHCEDLVILRYSLATYINIARHFRHIFATNGYSLIMPTILRIYSNIQSNPMVKKAIEYSCRQFYILHRLPFILQMLGSISPSLDADEQADVTDTNKIQPLSLFRLLVALEQAGAGDSPDEYSIMELIRSDSAMVESPSMLLSGVTGISSPATRRGNLSTMKQIKSLDFCYMDDDNLFTFLQCLDLCVSVVAYAPESGRSLQMLGIIDLLLPRYFDYLKDRTSKTDGQTRGREEVKIISKLSITMKTMINASETLTRTFVGPKHDTTTTTSHRNPRTSSRSVSIIPDDDSMSRFIDDRAKSRAQDADERKQAAEFRWPRDLLLSTVSNFLDLATQRLRELKKLLNDPTLRRLELLESKSYACLADIAHTLLKLSSFDPVTISCRGLQSYFQKLLPCTDWSQEQLRPALNLLLRRTDRILSKICKKTMTKRCFDWEATAGILGGIYLTVDRHPYIAHFPSFKTLVSGCIALILNESVLESGQSIPKFDTPTFPKEFSHAVIKLVGRYLSAIRNQPNLEAITSMSSSMSTPSSTITHLLHFLLPLMFWACSNQTEAPKLHTTDISYIVNILLASIKPASKLASTMGTQNVPTGPLATGVKQHLAIGDPCLPNLSFSHKSIRQFKDLIQTASLLGLKVLIIGFGKQLKREWYRITQAIKLICQRQSNMSTNLLLFIDFLVTYKSPIYIILRPFLVHHMHSVSSENDRDYELITSIHQKLVFEKIPPFKSTHEIFHDLRHELKQLQNKSIDESKVSCSFEPRPTGTERVRFNPSVLEQSKEHDDRTTNTSDERSSTARTTTPSRMRRQPSSEYSLNSLRKKRTLKVRPKEALDILEIYHNRCKAKLDVSDQTKKWSKDSTLQSISSMVDATALLTTTETTPLQTSVNSNLLVDDQAFVPMNRLEENSTDQSSTENEVPWKLRTFRGWQRHVTHTYRSRPKRSVILPHRSSEPMMPFPRSEEEEKTDLQSLRTKEQSVNPLASLFDTESSSVSDPDSNSSIALTEILSKEPFYSSCTTAGSPESDTTPTTTDLETEV